MPESLGARLRRQREEQNIALGAIAEQTKIKTSLLEALERDDVSHWPSGIFRRAYIRAYAHAIGLSPDLVLREFLEAHPEPVEEVDTVAAMGDGRSGPPTRLRYIVGSAIASLSRLRRGSGAETIDVAPVRESSRLIAPDPAPEAGSDAVVVEATPAFEPQMPVEQHVPAFVPQAASEGPVGTAGIELAVAPGDAQSTPAPPASELTDFATLCTELGRVERAEEVQPLLREAARILEAHGLIVWLWDASAGALRPALVHGYSDQVVAQLPAVPLDADNPTAAAFRTAEPCAVAGDEHANGALVVPLLAPAGCAGVLAIELSRERGRLDAVRAFATILAALLAQLTGGGVDAEEPETDLTAPRLADGRPQLLRVNARAEGYPRTWMRSSIEAWRSSAAEWRRPAAR